MLAFILRRLLQAIAVLLVVGLIAFSLFHFVGDPITPWSARTPRCEERERLREKLGLTSRRPCSSRTSSATPRRATSALSYRTSEPVSR